MKSKEIDQLIEETLRSEPAFTLKADFRDQVVNFIKKKENRSQRRFYFLLGLCTLLMLSFGVAFVMKYASIQSLSSMGDLMPISILVGVLIVLIQYLDKRLVKDRMFKGPV